MHPEGRYFTVYEGDHFGAAHRWQWDTPASRPFSASINKYEAEGDAAACRQHWCDALSWAQDFTPNHIRSVLEGFADAGA